MQGFRKRGKEFLQILLWESNILSKVFYGPKYRKYATDKLSSWFIDVYAFLAKKCWHFAEKNRLFTNSFILQNFINSLFINVKRLFIFLNVLIKFMNKLFGDTKNCTFLTKCTVFVVFEALQTSVKDLFKVSTLLLFALAWLFSETCFLIIILYILIIKSKP